MKYLYCMRCKAFRVTSPVEANCDQCKRELADEWAAEKRRGKSGN